MFNLKKNFSILLLLLLCSKTFGQLYPEEIRAIDSLKKIVQDESHDTAKINAIIAWDNIIYFAYPELDLTLNLRIDSISRENLNTSLNQKERTKFLKSQAFALNNLGLAYHDQGKYKLALEYYTQSLIIKQKIGNKKGMALSLNNIGSLYFDQGNFVKALDFYTESMLLNEITDDKRNQVNTLLNIGNIYETQNEIDKAVENYEHSLKLAKLIQYDVATSAALTNLGNIYYNRGDFNKAKEFYTESLKLSEEIGDQYGEAISYICLGGVFRAEKEYKKALEYDKLGLELSANIGNVLGEIDALNSMSSTYLELGNYLKAIAKANEALKISQESGVMEGIRDATSVLWISYKNLGKFQQSLQMHELYNTTIDSIQSATNQKEVIRHEYKFAYETQALADSLSFAKEQEVYNAEIGKQNAELRANRNLQVAMIGGIILIGVFAFFMYNRFKITNEQKAVIEEAHEELEEKNQEILDSINYAKRIQKAILPPDKLVKQALVSSFILYKPKDIVAGDFYWLATDSERTLFAAADCTGHGVPGAMVSVICNNGLNRSVKEFGLKEPGEILDKTRELVISEFEKSEEEVKDGMDIALCSLEGKTVKFAGAHNGLWIIKKDASELIEIKADKQPIGKFSEAKPFNTHQIELNEGDSLYIFSDGFADQFGGDKGKKYKSKNFKNLLLSIQNESMNRQKKLIDEAFNSWKGNLEQLDDVCVIGVRL